LLAWVSTTRDPLVGGGLLLSYAIGYVSPLILVGTFAASLKGLLALRRRSGWIVPTSGALLVGFGVFSLLSRLPIG
jgi:cytochrome c-type biogenesis protein